jgi:heme ABC exporter ATP-binding subunit CcmA
VPLDFDTLELREVSRAYGRRRALSKVSLTCRRGEIVGLLGPNGAGKSTLLGICSTIVSPGSGEVRYGGRLAREMGDALRGHIGVLGHDLFLYADLTARENLEFFGRLHGVANLSERVTDALALARLRERADDRVATFSRGLRQRLALERALLHQPRLVLLDEPFTGLDDESAGLLVARLRSIRDAGGIVLMATHDFDSADSLIDRAVCLSQGRLVPVPEDSAPLRDRYRRAIRQEATA